MKLELTVEVKLNKIQLNAIIKALEKHKRASARKKRQNERDSTTAQE